MLTPDQITDICERRERGQSAGQIARRFDISEETVRYHTYRLGAELPDPAPLWTDIVGPAVVRRGNHIVRRFTPAEDAELRRLAGLGMGEADIARAMKRPRSSIRNRLIRAARVEARKEATQ